MGRFYDLCDFQLFANCDKESINRFMQEASSRISVYTEGDIVVLQGTPCHSLMLLCQGTLSANMVSDEGKEIVIETLKAPEILAPAFLYGSENLFPVTLQAKEETQVWFLSRENFLELMESDRTVLRNFLQDISDRTVFLGKKLNEFALQNLSARIINYLKKHGSIRNVQEVASKMGVARPSLSRAISALLEEGAILKENNTYTLK